MESLGHNEKIIMKIIITANTSWYVWNFRLSLMKALVAKGHTLIVVAPIDDYSCRFGQEGIGFVPIFIQAKSVNPFDEIRTMFSFFHIYRTEKPDIVFQYTIKSNLYGSIAARFLRIQVVNNVSGLGAAFEKQNVLAFIVKALYRYAFKKVQTVFFQNRDDRNLFVEMHLVKPEIAGLLPGSGVDIERFKPSVENASGFTFLFVGRLLRAKGVEDFIQAARFFREAESTPVRFILLGSHDTTDPHMADTDLLKVAIADGTVIHLEPVEDVRIWLREAHCVVLPSWYREGVPRSLLEAASCGKPLIACDSIGTREPVTDSVNGYLCEPKNPRSLADKMLKLFNLPLRERQRMGTASRQIAETRFNERIVIDSYLEIVERFTLK